MLGEIGVMVPAITGWFPEWKGVSGDGAAEDKLVLEPLDDAETPRASPAGASMTAHIRMMSATVTASVERERGDRRCAFIDPHGAKNSGVLRQGVPD